MLKARPLNWKMRIAAPKQPTAKETSADATRRSNDALHGINHNNKLKKAKEEGQEGELCSCGKKGRPKIPPNRRTTFGSGQRVLQWPS